MVVRQLAHETFERKAPGGTEVGCTCGWRQGIPVRNALARAAKVGKYLRQHRIASSIETMARAGAPEVRFYKGWVL